MNYLTHYLIDHIPGNPNFNFGLALPDMVGIFKRGWRPDSYLFPVPNKNVNDIWDGFQRHVAADATFHNSLIFVSNTKRLRKELDKNGLGLPGIRLFFVAHVMLELMLDRHIIKTQKSIAEHFYEDLSKIDDQDIESFFKASGSVVPDSFFDFLNRFKESQYLYNYVEPNGIFFSINRLLKRTGQSEFGTEHENTFAQLIEQEESVMEAEIEVFLN